MTITITPPTRPTVIDVEGDGLFDILDPFHRVFWKDMDRETVLNAIRRFDSLHQIVPATGLPYNTKVRL